MNLKKMTHIALYLSCLLLAGCYQVPYLILDESEGVIDDSATGTWMSERTSLISRKFSLEISREPDSYWYDVRKTDLATNKVENLKAIAHDIGNHRILSYAGELDTAERYRILRVVLKESGEQEMLHVSILDEGAPRFSSKEEFKRFLGSTSSDRWFNSKLIFKREVSRQDQHSPKP